MARKQDLNRRQWLAGASAAATLTIIPRHVLGAPGQPAANDRLNIAGVGLGGMGSGDVTRVPTENIVALCDVDGNHVARSAGRFPQAKTPREKLLLVDWLIHQFHVMQGVANMPVGQNVIQGTTDQVRELIESLANGPSSTQGLSSLEKWRSVYYDPVRLFKQSHSHSQVQQIAAQLGIKGRSQMSEDELIPEILRRSPGLAAKPEDRKSTELV